ncbi:aldo-keto reductase family 1 member B1-like [Phymastichus coffea]|uniref:aldo-keto reductase family 1 member B1-like n=1 Tax=Phymastichus coffea TaxID=108790 RepID=UPI00273AA7AE|nr:aldo-keto reductase family 1 member B1-like [Phymastichus coffea]XP_058796846.1 aldo-keto reductase family 1 member B1-like [Phymastichus coffea]
MPPQVETIILSNGYKVPAIGLGTWQGGNDPGEVYEAVQIAIDEGYRHFDCASVYGNEAEIGKALQEKITAGVVKREDLYIVTKIWNDEHKEKLVVPACQRSLKKLGLGYIDLYLVHWPLSYPDDVDYIETWRGMEKCVELGFTRSIGVSNFNSQQLTRLLDSATIKPVMNQIEVHINLNQKKLREFCASKAIAVTGYSPFGAPGRCTGFQPPGPDINLQSPVITEIAKKYNKTNAQVALRYSIDIGIIPIPKSSSPKRLRENINVFDFKLTPEEIVAIDQLDCGFRTCNAIEYKECKEYPFNIEF